MTGIHVVPDRQQYLDYDKHTHTSYRIDSKLQQKDRYTPITYVMQTQI